jgi:hypothetical protein
MLLPKSTKINKSLNGHLIITVTHQDQHHHLDYNQTIMSMSQVKKTIHQNTESPLESYP